MVAGARAAQLGKSLQQGRQTSDLMQGIGEIDGTEVPVMDDQPAVDDDGANIGGASAVDEKIGAVKWLEVRLLQIDQDQVSGRARGK